MTDFVLEIIDNDNTTKAQDAFITDDGDDDNDDKLSSLESNINNQNEHSRKYNNTSNTNDNAKTSTTSLDKYLSPSTVVLSKLRCRTNSATMLMAPILINTNTGSSSNQNATTNANPNPNSNTNTVVNTPLYYMENDISRRYSNLSQCCSEMGGILGRGSRSASGCYADEVSMWSGVSGGLRSLSLIYNSPPPYLILERSEKMPLKDFCYEVRASLDIEKFVKEAILFLDITCTSLDDVIHQMLRQVFQAEVSDENPLEYWVREARKKLFIEASFLNYSYQRLSKTIKGISIDVSEGLAVDQSWICTMASLPHLHNRHLAIARLANPVNLGATNENIHFIILVIAPTKEKGTKSEIELGRTFSTIMADIDFRQQLHQTENEQQFREVLHMQARLLTEAQRQCNSLRNRNRRFSSSEHNIHSTNSNPDRKADDSTTGCCPSNNKCRCFLGKELVEDVRRRLPHYKSDFVDGVTGPNTLRKVISATSFLYFSCLLPSIAFGVLNGNNTGNNIEVKRVIMSQFIGGLVFALIGGQPLIVMLSTAPIALYTKVIYIVSKTLNLPFFPLFAWTGIFNSIFLVIYSITGLSRLMKLSTRSTEEVFALFVAIAFVLDASKDVYKDFQKHYNCGPLNKSATTNENSTIFEPIISSLISTNDNTLTNISNFTQSSTTKSSVATGVQEFHKSLHQGHAICHRDISVLYLLLMIMTVWLAGRMHNFTKTPFLNASKRELFGDFSLPLAITIMSFVGALLFRDIPIDPFYYDESPISFKPVDLTQLSWKYILLSASLAFPLSLLFFMEQGIAGMMVNSPSNKLKKGTTFHWDLFIVAIINGFLSTFGLPWIHGAIPHSPLHVKALSDIEEKIDSGHKVHQTIVRVRETRLTSLFSHILIALSIFLLPRPLIYIPIPVLDGLFVHMAISSLSDNQLCERISLLFTEQSAYPPSHYLRRVPQRKLHLFTFFQLLQLAILCALGFSSIPYMKLGFPLVLVLQLVVRHRVIPIFINEIYINEMDK